MKTKNKSIDPNYLKVGKFKKKVVYDAKVDMSDQMENTFENLGREHITKEQYINIGFNYAVAKGIEYTKVLVNKKNK